MPSINSADYGFQSVTPNSVLGDQLVHLSSDVIKTVNGWMMKGEFYNCKTGEKMYIKSGSAHILKYFGELIRLGENKQHFPCHFKQSGKQSYLFVDDSLTSGDPNRNSLTVGDVDEMLLAAGENTDEKLPDDIPF